MHRITNEDDSAVFRLLFGLEPLLSRLADVERLFKDQAVCSTFSQAGYKLLHGTGPIFDMRV
jgi:hypothetical protein